jgi:hypothetical protein
VRYEVLQSFSCGAEKYGPPKLGLGINCFPARGDVLSDGELPAEDIQQWLDWGFIKPFATTSFELACLISEFAKLQQENERLQAEVRRLEGK